MAWSSDPTEPTPPIVRAAWQASPVVPDRVYGPGWFNLRGEKSVNFAAAGTFSGVIRQVERVGVTLSGEGAVTAVTSGFVQHATAAFDNQDTSQTGALTSGLSAWSYNYNQKPVNFSGDGQLSSWSFDGFSAYAFQYMSGAPAEGSDGILNVLIYQKYARSISLSGSGQLAAVGLSDRDGFLPTIMPSLPDTETGVGVLAVLLSQRYSIGGPLAGTGALAAAARLYQIGAAAALAGSGALAGSLYSKYDRAAALASAGTLSSAQVMQYVRAVALSGAGALTGAARMFQAYAERADNIWDPGWETAGNSTLYKRNGTKSYVVTGDGTYYQTAPVSLNNSAGRVYDDCTAGQQVYVETWVYGDPANTQTVDTGISWGVGLWAEFIDSSGVNSITWIGDWKTATTALRGVWTKLSFTFTVPSGYNKYQVWFGVGPTVNAGEKYYFDDPIHRPINIFQGGGTLASSPFSKYARAVGLTGAGSLAAPLVPAISSGNTAYDPNFEIDGNSTDYARSGTKSVKMIADHVNWQSWPIGPWGWSTVPCNPGQQIYIEVWVLGKPTNTQSLADGVGATISFTDSSGVNPQIWPGQGLAISTALNGVWTRISYLATVPAGYDGYVSYCWTSINANAGETFYFDDPVSRPLNHLQSIGYLTAIAAKLENRSAALSGGGSLTATVTGKVTPVFTAVSTCPTTTNNTTSGSWSHAGGSYSNMCAIMVVQGLGNDMTGSQLTATYGGTSMTKVAGLKGNNTDTTDQLIVFVLNGCASGTQTAVINCSTGTNIHKAHVLTYANVQSLGTAVTAYGAGSSLSITASSSTADRLFTVFVAGEGVVAGGHNISSYSGTQRVNYTSDASIWQQNSLTAGDYAGTSSITSTATYSRSDNWCAVAVNIVGKSA